MLTRYKEMIYQCGENYIDMVVYPAYCTPQGKRRKRYRPTSDTQQRLNDKHREEYLTRLMNTNFTEDDYKVDITYKNEYLPETLEQAKRDIKNFIRRVKRVMKKKGLPELKYVYAIEKKGERSVRFHHHLVMTGGLTPKEIKEIWGKGYATPASLEFTETGISDFAKYMLKYARSTAQEKTNGNYCGYHCSRNLKKPKKQERFSKLNRRKIAFMFDFEDETNLENLFPGYILVKPKKNEKRIYYNDVNGGYYFTCRFYKPPNKQRKRKNE